MICLTCGHEERFHRDPSGKVMRCDVELAPEPGYFSVEAIKTEPFLCGCDNLQTLEPSN